MSTQDKLAMAVDTLRPEVAEAIRLFGAVIEELGLHDNYESALHVLCAELLRLATIEADALIALDCEHDWQVEHKRAEKAEAELLRLTDENARLLAANRDAMDHFEQMKAALAAQENPNG